MTQKGISFFVGLLLGGTLYDYFLGDGFGWNTLLRNTIWAGLATALFLFVINRRNKKKA